MKEKPKENYQVRDPEVEGLLKDIGQKLHSVMPKGFGFALLIFEIGEAGGMFYLSDAQREDMIKALEEFLEKNKDK